MSTHPTLDEILAQMGAAGRRLDHMGAVEAGAGNISVSVAAGAADSAWPTASRRRPPAPGCPCPPRPWRAAPCW